MATTSYGSITIVDIGDLGELSVTPQSNQPTMVIYDPNTGIYNPNWSTSHLILTPVVYYGGTNLLNAESENLPNGLRVTWTKRIGSGTPGAHGGSVTAGKLTIESNPFDPNTANLITYLVDIEYDEPSSGTTLSASGQITFGLIQNASKLKNVNISGQSVFLYDGDGTIQGASQITLTATVEGVSVTKWQYKDSTGQFQDIANSASNTLVVNHNTANYFNNDVGVFRVITNDNNVYDDHTIVKLRDGTRGADGTTTKSVILSNEDEVVPFTSATGTGTYTDCVTTINVYDGAENITTNTNLCRIFLTEKSTSDVATATVYSSSNKGGYLPTQGTSSQLTIDGVNVTGVWDRSNLTCSATNLTADTGKFIFYVYYKDGDNWIALTTKKFSLVKTYPGKDGDNAVFYRMKSSSVVTTRGGSNTSDVNVYAPASITLIAYMVDGNNESVYSGGIFTYQVDGGAVVQSSGSTLTLSFGTGTGKITPNSTVLVKLYKNNSAVAANLCDTQTITVVQDGDTGSQGPEGPQGNDALSFAIGNPADVIPCTHDGLTAAAYTITIPFYAYKGITRQACTASYTANPALDIGNNKIVVTNTAGTTSSEGTLKFTIPAGSSIASGSSGAATLSGTISITITSNSKTSTQTYTWSKNNKALDGTSAVMFQLYAPNGNVISNDSNNVVIKPQLNEGTEDKTSASGVTYTWKYWDGSEYKTCSGVSGYTIGTNQLTVAPSAVNSYVSIKCECSYGSGYDAYISIYDKTDPLQVTVLSSLGDKLINSVGTGILYTRVYRNGLEIDAIKTIDCGTSYPTSPTAGQYFWLLNTSTKTATLKKYSGSSWADSSDQTGTYNWTRLNPATGAIMSLADNTGKAIYLDASIVDSKTIFNVEVTI